MNPAVLRGLPLPSTFQPHAKVGRERSITHTRPAWLTSHCGVPARRDRVKPDHARHQTFSSSWPIEGILVLTYISGPPGQMCPAVQREYITGAECPQPVSCSLFLCISRLTPPQWILELSLSRQTSVKTESSRFDSPLFSRGKTQKQGWATRHGRNSIFSFRLGVAFLRDQPWTWLDRWYKNSVSVHHGGRTWLWFRGRSAGRRDPGKASFI